MLLLLLRAAATPASVRAPPWTAHLSAAGSRDMTSCSCARGMKLSSLAYVSVNSHELVAPFSTTYGSSVMLAFIFVTLLTPTTQVCMFSASS